MIRTLITVLILGAAFTCQAQEEPPVIGRVQPDGSNELVIPKYDLLDAIQSMHHIPFEHYAIWYRVHISEGARQYLVCEVDTFIIAYECEIRGRDILIKPDGITHIGILMDDCMNVDFILADDGEILGCKCVDKLIEGPRKSCSHTIKTPQTLIIEMIHLALNSPRRREYR